MSVYEHPEDLPWREEDRRIYLMLTPPTSNEWPEIAILPFRKGSKTARVGAASKWAEAPTRRVSRAAVERLIREGYVLFDDTYNVYRRTSPARRWAETHVFAVMDQCMHLPESERENCIGGYDDNLVDTLREKGYDWDDQIRAALIIFNDLLHEKGLVDDDY